MNFKSILWSSALLAIMLATGCGKAPAHGSSNSPGAHRPAIVLPEHFKEVAGPVRWAPEKRAFEAQGQALRAEKVWVFDGANDGFSMTSGEISPAQGAGLALDEIGADSQLLSPRGLNIDGHNRSLVLVRLTRVRAGPPFDGTLYYSTATHGVSDAYHGRLVLGEDPKVGETAVLGFDMHKLSKGEADWRSSIIDRLRLDLDDGAGGAFIIHQIAIAQNPGTITLRAPKSGAAVKPASWAP